MVMLLLFNETDQNMMRKKNKNNNIEDRKHSSRSIIMNVHDASARIEKWCKSEKVDVSIYGINSILQQARDTMLIKSDHAIFK